jgi:hypothetical protein
MSDESYIRSIVEPELENGEQLLWVGKPSPALPFPSHKGNIQPSCQDA